MKRLFYILPTLLSLGAFAQEVELSIEPRNAEVGEVLTITIESTVEGEVEVDNLPRSFVQGSAFQNMMNTTVDPYSGKMITVYQISYIGAIGKSGNYTIGPAYVKNGNKTFPSNTVEVSIGDKAKMVSSEITNQQIQDPAFGVILTNKSEIYEGEPILVSAKVYAHFDPTHIEGYQSYSMKGTIDRHPMGSNTRINKTNERFRGYQFSTFEYDKNVVFPSGTGMFKISPFKMNLRQGVQGFNLTSSSAQVTIKPLPANQPSNFIGGVGHFDVERKIGDSIVKQGDVFTMKITVSGHGNLQNILEPKPSLPKGFIIYGDPIVEENYSYTSMGAEGEISYEYNIQANKDGDIIIPATQLSYFDVKKEAYIIIATDSNFIEVEKDKNFAVSSQPIEDNSLKEINTISSLRLSEYVENDSTLFGSTLFWSGLSLPLLSSLFFLLAINRRKKSEEETSKKALTRQKNDEYNQIISNAKIQLAANDDSAYYGSIEQGLRKAFEIVLKLEEQRVLSKSEIGSYLEATNQHSLTHKVMSVFEHCEQARFGYVNTDIPKAQLIDEIEQIKSQLK